MHVSISRNKIRKFPASRAPTVLLFSATKNKLLICGGGAVAIKMAKGGQIASTHWVSCLALALYELRKLVPVHSACQRTVDRQQCSVHQLQVVLYQARLHGADEAAENLPAISQSRDVASSLSAYHMSGEEVWTKVCTWKQIYDAQHVCDS